MQRTLRKCLRARKVENVLTERDAAGAKEVERGSHEKGSGFLNWYLYLLIKNKNRVVRALHVDREHHGRL